jgi:hypothetical protein
MKVSAIFSPDGIMPVLLCETQYKTPGSMPEVNRMGRPAIQPARGFLILLSMRALALGMMQRLRFKCGATISAAQRNRTRLWGYDGRD